MLGNWFKTTLLMAAVIALFGIVGATLGGAEGMLIALLLGGGNEFFRILVFRQNGLAHVWRARSRCRERA